MNLDLPKLGKITSVSFLALAMAGCGGSRETADNTPPPPPPRVTVDLTGVAAGAMDGAMADMLTVAAGESMPHGNITFSCAAGGATCMIDVRVGADGMVTATSTGGMATADESDEYVANLEGSVGDLTGQRDAARETARLYGVAATANAAATAAAKKAAEALKSAMENSTKFGWLAVNGDSEVARMNAQAVLDGQTDVGTAITEAMTALSNAETALGMAKDTATMINDRAGVVAALEAAVEHAEAQLRAAADEDNDARRWTATS